MRKRTFFISIILAVIVLYWASFVFSLFTGYRLIEWAINSTERVIFVENANLESMPGIQVLDANNPFFQVRKTEPNRLVAEWKKTQIVLKESKCRVEKPDDQHVYVMAEFNNRQYPLIIDSGYDGALMVNDVLVIENELEVFPIETEDPTFAGFCHVDKIKIGDMTITTPPCSYKLSHYEKRVLGLTKWKQRQIIFGLELMRYFRYVLIDTVSSEVELSQDSFCADPIETWRHYRMSIENDKQNTTRLMIEIPIQGETTKIMFDTAYNGSLVMAENKWERLSAKLHIVKEANHRGQMPHGWEDIKKITVGKLSIGERNISDASVDVFSDESRYGPDFFLLGMGCFKDTVIVLDFERNLLWVRKPKSS